MVFLGYRSGHESNMIFMCAPNNVLFYGTTALFDETLFPKCPGYKIPPITQVPNKRKKKSNEDEEPTVVIEYETDSSDDDDENLPIPPLPSNEHPVPRPGAVPPPKPPTDGPPVPPLVPPPAPPPRSPFRPRHRPASDEAGPSAPPPRSLFRPKLLMKQVLVEKVNLQIATHVGPEGLGKFRQKRETFIPLKLRQTKITVKNLACKMLHRIPYPNCQRYLVTTSIRSRN